MAGHDRFVAGDVMRHLRQRLRHDAAGDFGFADVAGKLFQQLQIGKTQAADLDLAEDLMRPRLEHGFGFIDTELVGGDQLHRALFFRNGCHAITIKKSGPKINETLPEIAKAHLRRPGPDRQPSPVLPPRRPFRRDSRFSFS